MIITDAGGDAAAVVALAAAEVAVESVPASFLPHAVRAVVAATAMTNECLIDYVLHSEVWGPHALTFRRAA